LCENFKEIAQTRPHDRALSHMEDPDLFEDVLDDIDTAGLLNLWDAGFHPSGEANRHGAPPPSPLLPPCTQLRRAYVTSHKVFRRHMLGTLPDGSAHIDAKRLISRACYEDWLSTRSRAMKKPEVSFQRILTSYVTGTDGRTPFTPAEEAAVLVQIRQKRVWPAFADSPLTIGCKGFQSCVSRVLALIDRALGTASTKKPGCLGLPRLRRATGSSASGTASKSKPPMLRASTASR